MTGNDRVLLPECRLDVHMGCNIGAVYISGQFRVPADTPGAVLVIPAKRCDCLCHKRKAKL